MYAPSLKLLLGKKEKITSCLCHVSGLPPVTPWFVSQTMLCSLRRQSSSFIPKIWPRACDQCSTLSMRWVHTNRKQMLHPLRTKSKIISSNNKDLGSVNDLDFCVCLLLVFTVLCSHLSPIPSYKIHSL